MSTYINPNKPSKSSSYNDCPPAVAEYLKYTLTIRGLSARTVNGYYIDLRTFFRYLILHREIVPSDTSLDKIDVSNLDIEFIRLINKTEVYDFLYYITRDRENVATTRARKLSSLKGFFKYLTNKTGQISQNPMEDIDMPVRNKRLPKYLTLDESLSLLNNIQSDFHERDYCVIMLFLNCGIRLSELVGLDTSDIKEDTMRVIGKGDKERMLYLNEACLQALSRYMAERIKLPNLRDKNALFVSKRTGNRLTARRIQQIVSACFAAAGLDGKGYSVHKLRHTAATLLYQHGQVDLLSLKEMLGHVNVSTTEIYTHLDSTQLKKAAHASPLANLKQPKQAKKIVENMDNSGNNVESLVENVEKPEK